MKKRIILLTVLFCAISLQAQNCDSIARSIVEKIKNYSPDDLLPYYDKVSQEWGLMSKDGKILTQPLSRSPHEITFAPNLEFATEEVNCWININRNGYTYNVQNGKEIGFWEDDNPKSNPNVKGFITSYKSKRIIEYSNRYDWVINEAFTYNKKLYTIARLTENSKVGIIDEDGNTLPFFDFRYKTLSLMENVNDTTQLWFYFKDEKGKKGFINTEGKTKLYGKLLSTISGDDYYSVQDNNKKSGVLNLRTLKWAIKPQKKLNIENYINIGQNKNNFTYYVIVSAGDEKYLIDMNKKAYKPKK